MRSAEILIDENNRKRELLNDKNLELYEEFLLYIRTDLRVDEQAGEEVLMDLLDHLLDAQNDEKNAVNLFGDRPQAYADELIDALPKEKKRNETLFILSQISTIGGWFSIIFGLVSVILSFFKDIDSTISLGNLLVILGAVTAFSFSGVWVIFKIVRSSLFRPKKKRSMEYVKAGLFGAGAFGIIILLAWIVPNFGPVIDLQWWVYVIIGVVLLALTKIANLFK